MENIGYLFYKDYFSGLQFIKDRGEWKPEFSGKAKLDGLKKIVLESSAKPTLSFANRSFPLTTTYPGLLLGSGYAHEIGGVKKGNTNLVTDELKLGFYFDYTTGLPVIPGSSIKGVLRSVFPDKKRKKNAEKELLKAKKEEKAKWETIIHREETKEEYIKDIIEEEIDVFQLKDNIFEGKHTSSVYDRDIFLDAFPIKSSNKLEIGFGDKKRTIDGVLFGNDYITPHKDPLKDPKPIQFFKILPQVRFQFDFRLSDFKNNGETFTSKQKMELFERIIKDFGLGAKTNVGYGQFE